MRLKWFLWGRAPGPRVVLLVALSALNLAALPFHLDWKEVVSKDGSLRISFPTEPKFVRKDIESGVGRLTTHTFSLDEGPISFNLTWMELPAKYVRDAGPVRVLNGAKDAFFKRFKGTILSERIVQLGVSPGRDVMFESEDEVRIRLRMFLRGNRLVQTLVMSEPDMIEGADAKRFMESLKWD